MGHGVVDLGIAGLGPATPLARGGFAQVYQAEQLNLRRAVAVKVLFAPPTDKLALARFERECHSLGAVSHHPNIVVVHDRGVTVDGRPYIIMEYREGGSLADEIEAKGRLDPERVRQVGNKIADALAVAHEQGVIHRDVKPANILLSSFGEAALADFGIARIDGGHQTTRGQVSASVAHASREVLAGDEPTVQSDVYSLGSTLVELLTGRPPFVREDDMTMWQIVNRVMSEPPPDVAALGVPPLLAEVLTKAMSPDLSIRYGNAREFQAALASTDPVETVTALDPQPAPLRLATGPVVTGTGVVDEEMAETHLEKADIVTDVDASTEVDVNDGPRPDITRTGRRRRRRWPFLVGLLLSVAAAAGGVFAATRDRSDPLPEVVFPQARIEPLTLGSSHALSFRNADPGSTFRIVVDDQPLDEEPAEFAIFRAVDPGRHSVAVEVVAPDGSSVTTENVQIYVLPERLRDGYRVNLGAILISPQNWPRALREHDKLIDDGHEGLLLSVSESGQHWIFFIEGFDADADRAWSYCDRFGLDQDHCFAAPVSVDDG